MILRVRTPDGDCRDVDHGPCPVVYGPCPPGERGELVRPAPGPRTRLEASLAASRYSERPLKQGKRDPERRRLKLAEYARAYRLRQKLMRNAS